MELLYYDFFIWLNYVSFFITIADKVRKGRLVRVMYTSLALCGGLGAALGCLLSGHRIRRIGTFFVVGVIQAVLAYLLKGYLFP